MAKLTCHGKQQRRQNQLVSRTTELRELNLSSTLARLAYEPIHAPSEQEDSEPQVNWLPLCALHPNRKQRVHQECHCGKGPGPAPKSDLVHPPCPIDGTYSRNEPEHHVEAIRVPSRCGNQKKDCSEHSKNHLRFSSAVQDRLILWIIDSSIDEQQESLSSTRIPGVPESSAAVLPLWGGGG